MNQKQSEPSEKVVQQAKLHPNGWVYQIEGQYAPNQSVSPEDIVGAWKVDANGNIVGDFISNPNYKPKDEKKQDQHGF